MLVIKNLYKAFDGFALQNIHLQVEQSDYHILLGESGAGKSLLLEIIAGMQLPDKGNIILNNVDITSLPAHKRKTGLVFQSPAIFPNFDVAGNIGYPLHHLSAASRKEKVFRYAEMMGIVHLLQQRSTVLSGGELQRVALARILASDPLILLLDEPLSAIDASLRADIRGLLRKLNRDGMPVLHVTHDYEEAMALGNKISIIEKGNIVQTGTTAEVLENPRTFFAASFSGERNFFNVRFIGSHALIDGKQGENITIKLNQTPPFQEAKILIRANSISILLHEPDSSNMNNFKGVITSILPRKDGYQICTDIGVPVYANITSESLLRMNLTEKQEIWLSFKASAVEVIL